MIVGFMMYIIILRILIEINSHNKILVLVWTERVSAMMEEVFYICQKTMKTSL
jgi:hypothetical protein